MTESNIVDLYLVLIWVGARPIINVTYIVSIRERPGDSA